MWEELKLGKNNAFCMVDVALGDTGGLVSVQAGRKECCLPGHMHTLMIFSFFT